MGMPVGDRHRTVLQPACALLPGGYFRCAAGPPMYRPGDAGCTGADRPPPDVEGRSCALPALCRAFRFRSGLRGSALRLYPLAASPVPFRRVVPLVRRVAKDAIAD